MYATTFRGNSSTNWKSDEFGCVSKAKSRLVAREFQQREGIDFGETFAPSSCVCLLSAIACELDLDVCHFDIEQAIVQSKLDEDVFLRLPRECGRLSGKVVRLNKSLYGLKQASRSWHAHLTTCLKTLGFQQCLADACVFRLVEEGRAAIIAVVHVDDIFAVGSCRTFKPGTSSTKGMLNFVSKDQKTMYCMKLLLKRAEQDGETIRRAAHRPRAQAWRSN